MKENRYLIIELNKRNDGERVKLWAEFHESRKREAKQTYRNLKRHCTTMTQWVLVKLKKERT